jgi:hypothetical protein
MTSAAFESWGGGECRVLTHMHILAQTARVFNNSFLHFFDTPAMS